MATRQSTELSEPRPDSGLLVSPSDGAALVEMLQMLGDLYHLQELGPGTTQVYLHQFARMAARHGVLMVREALQRLCDQPGRKLFPHPGEAQEELAEMAETERLQRLKDHPFVACVGETHYDGGLVMRFDKDGNREMRECECKKRWRDEHRALAPQPKKAAEAK